MHIARDTTSVTKMRWFSGTTAVKFMPSDGERCAAGLWGLDRIDERPPAREYSYRYQYDGTGIHIYVVDTVRLIDCPALM